MTEIWLIAVGTRMCWTIGILSSDEKLFVFSSCCELVGTLSLAVFEKALLLGAAHLLLCHHNSFLASPFLFSLSKFLFLPCSARSHICEATFLKKDYSWKSATESKQHVCILDLKSEKPANGMQRWIFIIIKPHFRSTRGDCCFKEPRDESYGKTSN